MRASGRVGQARGRACEHDRLAWAAERAHDRNPYPMLRQDSCVAIGWGQD